MLRSAAGESPSALESREAAAAIVDDLAQASLIYRLDVEGLARFRMYECLRQCAIEALSVSEQAVTVERIAAFLAETGSSLSDWTVSLDEQRIRALRADLENYRSLWTQTQEQPMLVRCFVQLGCVLGSIYLAEGPLVESQRVLTRTVELPMDAEASVVVPERPAAKVAAFDHSASPGAPDVVGVVRMYVGMESPRKSQVRRSYRQRNRPPCWKSERPKSRSGVQSA